MATAVTTRDQRAAELNVISRKQRSLWGDALYRLIRNRAALVGLVVIAVAALTALLAPWISPYDPLEQHGKDDHSPKNVVSFGELPQAARE